MNCVRCAMSALTASMLLWHSGLAFAADSERSGGSTHWGEGVNRVSSVSWSDIDGDAIEIVFANRVSHGEPHMEFLFETTIGDVVVQYSGRPGSIPDTIEVISWPEGYVINDPQATAHVQENEDATLRIYRWLGV